MTLSTGKKSAVFTKYSNSFDPAVEKGKLYMGEKHMERSPFEILRRIFYAPLLVSRKIPHPPSGLFYLPYYYLILKKSLALRPYAWHMGIPAYVLVSTPCKLFHWPYLFGLLI